MVAGGRAGTLRVLGRCALRKGLHGAPNPGGGFVDARSQPDLPILRGGACEDRISATSREGRRERAVRGLLQRRRPEPGAPGGSPDLPGVLVGWRSGEGGEEGGRPPACEGRERGESSSGPSSSE